MTTEVYVEEIKNIINSIEDNIKLLNKEIYTLQGKQEDLLHVLENEKFNASDGYKLAKMIQELRAERRNKKNELQTLEILKNNLTNNMNKRITELFDMIFKVRESQIEAKRERIYKPRVLHTMNVKELILSM